MINTLDLFMDWLIIRIASLLHVTWCRRMMKKNPFPFTCLHQRSLSSLWYLEMMHLHNTHVDYRIHWYEDKKIFMFWFTSFLFSYWLSNLKNHDYEVFSDHSIFLFEISRQIEMGVFGCFLTILLHASGNGDVTATIILKMD